MQTSQKVSRTKKCYASEATLDPQGDRDDRERPATPGGRRFQLPIFSREQRDLIKDHIERNIAETITVRSLMALTGLNKTEIQTAFKLAYGTTLAQYVIGKRIERAQTLLSETELPLSVVAAESGFANQSHLTTTLRRYLGMTPRALRLAAKRVTYNREIHSPWVTRTDG